MKQLLFLSFFFSSALSAQNLIPNPGFENHTGCPSANYQFYQVNNWFNPTINIPGITGTPDYFNACATYMDFSVPGQDPYHYQYAHGGDAHAGIWIYYEISIFPNFREYISAHLISPLVAGECYDFEMYVNMSNGSSVDCSSYGAYFSDTLVNTISNYNALPFTPQIVNAPTNFPDTLNWTLLSGQYMAHGGESYIIIGNFFDNANTDTIDHDSSHAGATYLYIDDVSLTLTACTGINEFGGDKPILVSPNPFNDQLKIDTNESLEQIMIYDNMGVNVFTRNYSANNSHKKEIINTSFLPEGFYFLHVKSSKRFYTYKIVKIK